MFDMDMFIETDPTSISITELHIRNYTDMITNNFDKKKHGLE